MPKKNKLVKSWVHEHINDHYVNMAQKFGYRSRAAYKLLELDADNKLFENGSTVVDLGCAPGSWSQVALQKVGSNGNVIGIDLLDIEPIVGLNFFQGDFSRDETLKKLVDLMNGRMADLIISDMSPNLSGIKNVDQARSGYLIELVLDFAKHYLKINGTCVIKIFQGSEFNSLLEIAKSIFKQVLIKKPEASKSRSSEIYLLCKNKKINMV